MASNDPLTPDAGDDCLITQLYVEGAPENHRDFVLNGIRDVEARRRLVMPFETDPTLRSGEFIARLDTLLGRDARVP